NSGNAYDSLAEGYFKDGQFEKSIQNYQKSLELDNENNNARVMIDIIRKQLEGK
ncbi:MAG: serine hydrolase, partial [Bacteroidetes bacterium]|nr:serine hydrolase [Bacteroidota bacterium]